MSSFKLIGCVLLLATCINLFGQDQLYIDSLHLVFKNKNSSIDTKVSALTDITFEYLYTSKDSFFSHNQKLYDFSKANKSNQGKTWAYWTKSEYFNQISNYDSLEFYQERALESASKIEDSELEQKLRIKTISDHHRLLNPDKALFHIQVLKRKAEEEKDWRFLGVAFAELGYYHELHFGVSDIALKYCKSADSVYSTHNLINNELGNVLLQTGLLYFDIGDFNKAEEYYERAKEVYQQIDNLHNLEKVNIYLGQTAIENQDYTTAIITLNKTLTYFEKVGQPNFVAICHNLLGNAYLKEKSYDKSIDQFEQALSLRTSQSDTIGILENMQALGDVYYANGQFEKSKMIIASSLKLSKNQSTLELRSVAYELMARNNIQTAEYKKAYQNLKKHIELNDQLLYVRNIESLQKLEAKYETTKKQNEIEKLTLENQLSDSQLERKRAIQTRLVAIVLLLALGLAFLWFWMNTQKRIREIKFHQQMQGKNEMINRLQEQLNLSLTENEAGRKGELISMGQLNTLIQNPLSEREYEVLATVAKGNTNQEVSEQLFISSNTVKYHLKNIYNKLEVTNRVQALNLLKQ